MLFCNLQLLDVLPAVLQHGAGPTNTKLLCSLLQVSASVRRAVLDSDFNVKVVFATRSWMHHWTAANRAADHAQVKAMQFAAWLLRHARLLSSLTMGYGGQDDDFAADVVSNALRRLVEDEQPLRLTRLSWHRTTAAVLQSVSAQHTLTTLALSSIQRQQLAPEVLPAHVAQLTGLQQLELQCSNCGVRANRLQWSGALQQLTRLTSLQLRGIHLQPSCIQLLPASLSQLTLTAYSAAKGSQAVSLEHLSALKTLDLKWAWYPGQAGGCGQATLPPCITQLKLAAFSANLPAQLRMLRADTPSISTGVLRQLQHTQHLEALELDGTIDVPPWVLEAQDRGSHVDLSVSAPPAAVQATLDGLAACTRLTQLQLTCMDMFERQPQFDGTLQCLRSLQALWMYGTDVSEQAVLGLSALTNLTSLCVSNCRAGFTDEAAVAVLPALTKLTVLRLKKCSLCTEEVLPAVAALTNLQELSFAGNPVQMMLRGLMQLTGLTALESLTFSDRFEHLGYSDYTKLQALMPRLEFVKGEDE
jgi:hypothetical protein